MQKSFRLFSFEHIIATLLTLFTIALSIKLLEEYNPKRLKKSFDKILAVLIVFQNLSWRILFIISGEFHIEKDLPFHVCSVTQFLLAYHLLKNNQTIFNICYYWVIAGSTFAIIIPDLELGFPSVKYFEMFISHGISIFTIFYLILIQKQYPTKGSWKTAFAALMILAIVDSVVNYFTNGNYLFLRRPPDVNFGPISLLPAWPWYLLVLAIFFMFVYWLSYQPYAYHERKISSEEVKNHN
ncbi:MAG: TIGR02206 family membrane protein [Candidatus Marinimicrobia bacterium]|nr:TIGR02206 family membrane protein [Candidatus Neomarinimicrobiota bacterium]